MPKCEAAYISWKINLSDGQLFLGIELQKCRLIGFGDLTGPLVGISIVFAATSLHLITL